MIWAAMSSAGVGPLCFLKSTVNAAIYQEILEHFMLPSADKLYGDADFIFQQDLAPAHTAKGTKSWFNDHGVTVLDWPANLPDLNPIENLWRIVKRKMRDTRLVLGDMVIFHIVISPACEIADTRYYRAWVGVGKRETLCTCHKLFHNYLVILNRACLRERLSLSGEV